MIDLEKILVIAVGSLVIVNFCAALALTVDWRRTAVRVRRFVKYWRVTYARMQPEKRQEYAFGASVVVFFAWWALVIVKGW
jgi:ABC-type nickel/cobalt efflux system permease component RcnA